MAKSRAEKPEKKRKGDGGKSARVFSTSDASAAFEHYKERAKNAAKDASVYNADLNVVPANVEFALRAVREHLQRDDVTVEERQQIEELPALVLALVYAHSRCVVAESKEDTQRALSVLRPLRQACLSYLDAASSEVVGLLPRARVEAIRAGKGPIDEARDGIVLAALFKEFASVLEGKHPFQAAQLATLEATGIQLLRTLSPEDAALPKVPSKPSEEEIVRNGLWVLVNNAFDALLLLAAKVWGVRRVHDHVPSLLSRGTSKDSSAPAQPVEDPKKP